MDYNLYYNMKKLFLFTIRSDKDKKVTITETRLMGYEQGELLTCIDNGQLPATLAEQLELTHSDLFIDGCIIAEVRDYRKVPYQNKQDLIVPEIHHVLLKPSTQVCTLNYTYYHK